ncbi:MAG: 50S ribosomal protein L12, partial [Nanoarchaeota archaeon]
MEYIYGALLLHKLGHPVTEENLKKVIHATGSQVDESKLKALIASLHGVDIGAELENANVAVATP